MKKRTRLLAVILALVILLGGGFALYVGNYYHAEDHIAAVTEDATLQDGNLVFAPKEAKAGLIFYPGGKVEYTAYSHLMSLLAEKGILCVLISMPCNLAVLDMNAADGIQEEFPEVEHWYIGGHSLGGAMAASYAANHTDELDGLILLAAYSTADLAESTLDILQIYGTEDGVMNRTSFEKYAPNLPASTDIQVINGGCHAWFGCYGVQDGDGTPSISAHDQQQITAQLIEKMIIQSK